MILLGPSHYASFEGAALTDAEAYETPLGYIPISAKAAELAKNKPFAVNPPCQVKRPDFWRQSPKELPAFGEDKPDTWEHSLEVQMPFLQRTLKNFEIVPVVYGEVDPLEAAQRCLTKILDDRTLIIASSDLSHYYPYAIAKQLDDACVLHDMRLEREGNGPRRRPAAKCPSSRCWRSRGRKDGRRNYSIAATAAIRREQRTRSWVTRL